MKQGATGYVPQSEIHTIMEDIEVLDEAQMRVRDLLMEKVQMPHFDAVDLVIGIGPHRIAELESILQKCTSSISGVLRALISWNPSTFN